MRVIKFRGRRCDSKEWVYGNYVDAKHNYTGKGIHREWIITGATQNGGWFNVLGRHAVVGDTVGQYTGLKDKNGKEIYEGDIVTFEDAECDLEGYHDNVFLNVGVVVYDEVSMRYYFTNRQTVDMDDLYIPADVEVNGNIYENPELLKEVEE